MSVIDEVSAVLVLLDQAALDWPDVVAGRLPESLGSRCAAIVDELTSSLTAADSEAYGGFVGVVTREAEVTGPKDLALAKFVCLLGIARQRAYLSGLLIDSAPTSPVFQKHPELLDLRNESGLLPFGLFEGLVDAVAYKESAVRLFADDRLTRALLKLSLPNKDDLLIRLSESQVWPRRSYNQLLQEAVEFGPTFSEQRLWEAMYKSRVATVLSRLPTEDKVELALRRLNPQERFEVLRTERNGMISILMEELVPLTLRDIEIGYIKTRIFHCDLVIGRRTFEHIDASCLVYSVDTYQQRLEARMEDKVKAEGHVKLFWVKDRDLSVWRSLLFCVFPRNELVVEYLTGEPTTLNAAAGR